MTTTSTTISTITMTRWLARLAAPLALIACGTGSTPTGYRPPIATLHASVGGITGPASADLRLALIWISGLTPEGFPRRVAQDVAWKRVGATGFEIEITERPPDEVLQDGPIVGNLVAYHDLNHNEQLDFATVADTAFTDTLVAFDADLSVEYNEIDGAGGITLNRGMPADTPITLYGSPAPRLSCHLLDWVPRTAFEAGRHLFGHDLDVGPWRYQVIYDFPECPGDAMPPNTRRLACDGGAFYASWTTQTSAFIASTCGEVMRYCERGHDVATALPPDWPCPCDPTQVTCASAMLDI